MMCTYTLYYSRNPARDNYEGDNLRISFNFFSFTSGDICFSILDIQTHYSLILNMLVHLAYKYPIDQHYTPDKSTLTGKIAWSILCIMVRSRNVG